MNNATANTPVRGYKVFNSDWTCRGFQFEVGQTYSLPEGQEPIPCKQGFHFCEVAVDCFNYYSFDPSNKVAVVEAIGAVVSDGYKSCTNVMKVVEEISWEKLLTIVNTGKGNSGNRNSGNRNSGNQNSGYWNSGNRNSGNQNSGYWNSGNQNSGNRNSGNQNSGNQNSGYQNSGNWNSGNWNSGNQNSGNWNSGNQNSGNWNSGNQNSGNQNSGYQNSGNQNSGNQNSGNQNSGYQNSGNQNSGNQNSGYQNSGNWNSGNWNSGYLNSTTPTTIRVFNKEIDREAWEGVEVPKFFYFNITRFVHECEMSEEEKGKNNGWENVGGYLKTLDYKEAWQESYRNASQEDRELVKKLPNFDADVFFEITGIRVE